MTTNDRHLNVIERSTENRVDANWKKREEQQMIFMFEKENYMMIEKPDYKVPKETLEKYGFIKDMKLVGSI